MSLLTAFMASAAVKAESIIGAETLTIGGGTAVNAVLNEVTSSKDFTETGFSPGVEFSAVIRRAAWIAAGYSVAGAQYVTKSAVARSLTFRVDSVSVGQSFVRVGLKEKERS
jgi:hypothetical protein